MIELSIADNPHFELSRIDVDRPGPHYTLDMVKLHLEQYGPGTDLYFLMGLDFAGRSAQLARANPIGGTVQPGGAQPAGQRVRLG